MKRLVVCCCSFALLLAACGNDSSVVDDVQGAVASRDSSETAANASSAGRELADQLDASTATTLKTLTSAMDLVGFDELAAAQEVTLFAPNDSAFTAMDVDDLAAVLADPDLLRDLVKDHVVYDTIMSDDLSDLGTVTTAGGLELTFDLSGPVPTVNGIEIVRTDVVFNNGVLHVLDGVLSED